MNSKINYQSRYFKVLALGYAFSLNFIIVLSFAWTPPQFDELPHIFHQGQNYFEDPYKIWDDALNSSRGGWSQGRFVPPLMHISGNFFQATTFALSYFFDFDIIFSYGIVRMFLTLILVLSFIYFLKEFLPNDTDEKLQALVLIFGSSCIGIFMISNHLYSSLRLMPAMYTFSLSLSIFCLAITTKLSRYYATQRSFFGSKSLAILLGIFFGSTYELTQLLGPMVIVIYVAALNLNLKQKYRYLSSQFIKKTIYSPFIWLFFISYIVPFVIIRLNGIRVCSQMNCYEVSELNTQGLDLGVVFNRVLSGFPIFSLRYGLQQQHEGLNLKLYIIIIFILFLSMVLTVFLICNQVTQKFELKISDVEKLKSYASNLFGIGLFSSFLFAVGASLSTSFQTAKISIGQSSIDTIMQTFAYSLIACGFFILLTLNYGLREKSVFFYIVSSLVISILLSLTFTSNMLTSRNLNKQKEENYIYNRFASELKSPNLTGTGNQERCLIIKRMIEDYPAWEGHDRLIAQGLNRAMIKYHKIEFCNVPYETLFKNYKK